MLVAILAGTLPASAQEKKDESKVKKEIKKDAKAVGNKAAEVGAKTKAIVVDKVYADKKGPDGQTIYINKHAKYYYIDDKGHKHFIKRSQMKDK